MNKEDREFEVKSIDRPFAASAGMFVRRDLEARFIAEQHRPRVLARPDVCCLENVARRAPKMSYRTEDPPRATANNREPRRAAMLIEKAAELKAVVDELSAGPDLRAEAPAVEARLRKLNSRSARQGGNTKTARSAASRQILRPSEQLATGSVAQLSNKSGAA
jgi:hypothetical protein